MDKMKYAIVALIDGQEFSSKNNTFEEFNALLRMIRFFGGQVVEYIQYEDW